MVATQERHGPHALGVMGGVQLIEEASEAGDGHMPSSRSPSQAPPVCGLQTRTSVGSLGRDPTPSALNDR